MAGDHVSRGGDVELLIRNNLTECGLSGERRVYCGDLTCQNLYGSSPV